jgi:ketosteroid isomerase-like protein
MLESSGAASGTGGFSMTPAIAPEEFRLVNDLFSSELLTKRNFSAIDRIYTSNATVLPPGAPMITGRENVRNFWKSAIEALNPTGGRLETLSLEVLGDTAVEIGRATLESASSTLEVKYVVVWKREDDLWKLHVDIWNPNT